VKTAWYIALVAAICFEGLGRKYLPQIPAVAFYFIKDVVLLFGYLRFRPPAHIGKVSEYLYRGFKVVWIVGFAWTVLQAFNPEHGSAALALIGLRAYWLWWAAPPIIASVLADEKEKTRAIYVLLITATAVAVFAAIQFVSPASSALNIYSVVDGEEVAPTIVFATGRSRVSSTFSYISGFSNFTTLIPTLILSLGLDTQDRRLRRYALIVTCITAAVVPMSGSRSSVVLGGVVLVIAAWTAGLFFTRVGRRILIGGAAAAVVAVAVFPEAFAGVESRFQDAEETRGRFVQTAATVLPPVALATFEYPPFGLGTGMLQNARQALRVPVRIDVEAEVGRYLVELGPVGFLLIWGTKFGLMVALLRAYALLKRAGRRGGAAAALSYAFLTLIGNLAFDHIWQALYFMGCGFILAEVVSLLRGQALARQAQAPGQAAAI
jgi:hypothetical protein